MPRLTDYRPLASNSLDKDGLPISFGEQLTRFAYGDMASGDMFVVSTDAVEAGLVEAGHLPIMMSQRVVKKTQVEHEIGLSTIRDIPDWLMTHPLSLESITKENALVVITDAKDTHENEIIIAMHLEVEKQGLAISEIASVYGKRNLAYLIENTAKLGKGIYPNERTGDWILRTGLQLPEQIANRLHLEYSTPTSEKQFMATPRLREVGEACRASSDRSERPEPRCRNEPEALL